MQVIDAHVHTFASPAEGIAAQGGARRSRYDGVVDELVAMAERRHVTRFAAMPALPIELVRRAWIGRGDGPDAVEERLVAFMRDSNDAAVTNAAAHPVLIPAVGADATIDPDAMRAELERHARAGVRIVKIHPALNFVAPTHPGYAAVFRFATDAELVVVAHGGAAAPGLYDAPVDYCAPERYAPLLAAFPQVRLVIAHLAQPYRRELISLATLHPNLYTDLSFVLGIDAVSDSELRAEIRAFGVERVLFGSDFPYYDPELCLDRLCSMGLGSGELEALTAGNAASLFGLV